MRKNLTLILFTTIVLSLFLFNQEVRSSLGDNVFGWAWSENIGWISFNNITGGGGIDYGLNVDSNNGKLSGYAWSENIGWISLNETDTGSPPSDDPCADTSCIAKFTPSGQFGKGDVNIIGWARALAHNVDWDGWIRFDHGQTDEVYIDSNGDFHGWAWGSDIIGWISFNSSDPGAGGAGYKVTLDLSEFNQIPSAINLSVAQGDYCFAPYPPIILSWEFFDADLEDFQSAYQAQVDNNSDFSSPEKDSGKVSSSSSSYAPIGLSYNTTYYWRIKVWDSGDEPSDWAIGSFFVTASHYYPDTDFSWMPESPAAEELIQFTDQTTYYNGATSWNWNFGDGNTSTEQNATHSYPDTQIRTVTLQACDNIGCCSINKEITVSLPLPEWEEIAPF